MSEDGHQLISAKEENAYPGVALHRTLLMLEDERFKNPVILDLFKVTTDEKKQEERVAVALWKQGCVVETFSTSTLYHAEDLPFPLRGIPDVFTTFRKKIEKEAGIRPVFDKPETIPSPIISPM